MGSSSISWDSSLGVTVSNSSAPSVAAQFYYTPAYDGSWRFPAYYIVDRQAGSLGGNDGADHHSIIVDSDTCAVWETYHAYVNPQNGSIETGNTCSGKPCNMQSGWHYLPSSYGLPTQGTTDAAGLPLLPLLWRAEEILNGTLQHPVRFTLGPYNIQSGNPQWPAVGGNGKGGPNTPPYGTRLRLKASVAAGINLSNLSATQQVYAKSIITALEQYGMVVADIGANLNANVDDEAGQNPDIMAALKTVGGQVVPADLEAVDLSSLKGNASSYKAGTGPNPAIPIRVGIPSTYLNIQAGQTMQLSSWVWGSTNQGVTWAVESGSIGTVTASGLYTPPASVSALTTGTLIVHSTANPASHQTLVVNVLPAGPIRIAAGRQSGVLTDSLGHAWQPNVVFRGGNSVYLGGDAPAWSKPANSTQAAELAVYETANYTYGNDLVGKFVVPNGTYSIRLMFAQPYNGSSPSTCSPFPQAWHHNVSLEVQDAIVAPNFDFGKLINYACAVPVDANLSATVTNNVLEVALRNTTPDGSSSGTAPVFSGVEIIKTN